MYYQHFGLSGPPFSPAFRATPLFLSAGHREALAALEWGMREPSGFTLVVGEFGTGKTTLILSLLAQRLEGVRAAWLADPKLSFEEMLETVAAQFNMQPHGAGRFALLRALDEFLTALKPGQSVALIFDEAQELSDEILEELRLLGNLHSTRGAALQIILVGQLDLARRLGRSDLKQLNQRIGTRTVLPTLKPDEIREYVEYRLRAHGSEVDKLFTGGAIRALVRHSGGIPRRINVLCENALLGAFADGTARVSAKHMRAAAGDYDDLLGTANRRAAQQPMGTPARIPHQPNLNIAQFMSVCVLVLLTFGVSYLLTSLALASFQPTPGKLSIISLSYGNQPRPGVKVLPQDSERDAAAGQRTVAKRRSPAESAKTAGVPQTYKTTASTADATQKPGAGGLMASPPPQIEAALPGPAAAAEDPEAKTKDTTVVVKKGDSLQKIASRYFGSVRSDEIRTLVKANPQIVDANRIYPGQIITLRLISE